MISHPYRVSAFLGAVAFVLLVGPGRRPAHSAPAVDGGSGSAAQVIPCDEDGGIWAYGSEDDEGTVTGEDVKFEVPSGATWSETAFMGRVTEEIDLRYWCDRCGTGPLCERMESEIDWDNIVPGMTTGSLWSGTVNGLSFKVICADC